MDCLSVGTKILLLNGYTPIENIVEGDQIISDDFSIKTITKIYRYKYTGKMYVVPVNYYQDKPFEPFLLTRFHRFKTANKWKIPKKHLLPIKVTNHLIYNLEIHDNHNFIANGIIVESFKGKNIL